MKIDCIKLLILFFLLSFIKPDANTQVDYDKYKTSNSKVLIKNVLLVKRADENPKLSSILIADGKIIKIGNNLNTPFDARIMEMDSMFAYPAFIAGISNVGIELEEDEKEERVKFTGAPGNKRAGITPEISANSKFNGASNSVAQYRKSGFAMVHSVPFGKMIPGKGGVFSLSGKNNEFAMIRNDISMFSQFKTADGVYPKTDIAILAKWRDLYNNAKLASKYIPEYTKDPINLVRPQYDKSVHALIPVATGEVPIFFKASNAKQIYRVIALQKDLGFKLCLVDVKQSWFALEALKKLRPNVLISVNLPKKPSGYIDLYPEVEKKKTSQTKDDSKDENSPAEERRNASYEQHINQAGLLDENNIEFGFSFIKTNPSKLHELLLKMIASGLSEQTAFEALTSVPARVLGVSNIAGSLEEKKLANLFITDKNYFEEESKIKYVFVEGKLFDYSVIDEKETIQDTTTNLSGSYRCEIDNDGQIEIATFVIKTADDKIEIQVIHKGNPNYPVTGENIKLTENSLKFDFSESEKSEGQVQHVNLEFDMTFDTFLGTLSTSDNNFKLSGVKIDDPK